MSNQTAIPPEYARWLDAMLLVARHYGVSTSAESVRVAIAWESKSESNVVLQHMAKQLGLALRLVKFTPDMLNPWRLPLVAELKDGNLCVIQTSDGKGKLGVVFSGDDGLETELAVADFVKKVKGIALLRPQTAVPDARVDHYIEPYKKNWLWSIALKDWKRYGDVMIASLLANVLALSGILFSMQVYDRVIPSNSEPTLWVLFGGVMLAIAFEFTMRMSRTHISDTVGKRADLGISDRVFGHALRVRNADKPKSTGTFISQLREMDQVRELFTSTTIGALADLPFFLLFLVVLWLVGGPLVLVSMAAIPLLIIPGLLVQKPMAKLSTEGMRESALRNAMLVESVQGGEDIKLMRAEPRFQNQWNFANDTSASISMKQRFLTSFLMTWTQELQSMVFVLVLAFGSYLVMNGDMTTGALVATSILSSRMISPLAQVSGIFARWQQAKVARSGLDEIMKRPVDHPEASKLIHRSVLHGLYEFSNVQFKYDEEDRTPALKISRLVIRPGEKIAILGRIGAGKSTLLQLMSGMQVPQHGRIKLDGIDFSMLDPSDVRRDLGYLTQNSRLFYGTIRDNIIMGAPLADDNTVMKALAMTGALPFVQSRSEGLDSVLWEGGVGLSGGQRQALLLARTIIRNPGIVLLDEPTANFDETTEQQVVETIGKWAASRTLIVATHRPALLKWVDRIIVIDQGGIRIDGPKDQVLKELSK